MKSRTRVGFIQNLCCFLVFEEAFTNASDENISEGCKPQRHRSAQAEFKRVNVNSNAGFTTVACASFLETGIPIATFAHPGQKRRRVGRSSAPKR